MNKRLYPAFAAFFISLSAFVWIASPWKVKSNECVIEFTGGNIHGTLTGLKADIVFDKEHLESAKITASVDATSLATGFFIKTMHAKDALGVDTNPLIKFVSTAVSKTADAYQAKGDLTLKSVTKPVIINFTFDDKGNNGVFKGTFKIIPKDFGIDRYGTPKEVVINLTVPVTK